MLATEFAESLRQEHRAMRDILLALRDALDSGEHPQVQEGLDELAGAAGPHLLYEGEALYPALSEFYGDDYVDRLLAEHEQTLEAARALAELADSGELSDQEMEQAAELVNELLTHVSERDGLAVMIEVLPPERLGPIVKAREQARKAGTAVHRAARRAPNRGATKPAARKRGRIQTAAKPAPRKGKSGKVAAGKRARAKPARRKSR